MHSQPTWLSLGAALLLLTVPGARGDNDEASEAALQDPTAECTYVYWPPMVAANVTGATPLPISWQPLTGMLPNDPVGQQKYASIKDEIPNIAPKGVFGSLTPFENVTYDEKADPDCWWTRSQCVQPKFSGIPPDIANVPEPRTLGYGFDDGPNCSHNAFYDYLTEQKQKATMFYIGSNVVDWPLQAQRAVADGHEICVHTWSHRPMTTFTNEGAFAELYYSIQAIKVVTGVTPKCWRPPTGDVDDRIRYIANKLGLETILWKFDSFDYTTEDKAVVQGNYDAFLANLTAGVFNTAGAIILAHELNNFTMEMAVENYPKLSAAFDYIVPIATAQNKTTPYVETNYTMQSFADYTGSRPKSGVTNSSSTGGTKSGSSKNPGASGTSAGTALRLSGTGVAIALTFLGAALCL